MLSHDRSGNWRNPPNQMLNGLQKCSIASPKMPQCQGLDRRGDAPIRVHDKLGLEMTKERTSPVIKLLFQPKFVKRGKGKHQTTFKQQHKGTEHIP